MWCGYYSINEELGVASFSVGVSPSLLHTYHVTRTLVALRSLTRKTQDWNFDYKEGLANAAGLEFSPGGSARVRRSSCTV